MSTNFLPFNPLEINQETDAEWAADSTRSGGIAVDQLLPSPMLNKAWFQTSAMAVAIANFIANVTGATVTDNQAAALIEQLGEAVNSAAFCGTSGGSANAQTLTPTIPLLVYTTGIKLRFVSGFTNSGATTLNISGRGAISVEKQTLAGLAPLSGGEFVTGQIYEVAFDGSVFQIVSDLPVQAVNSYYSAAMATDLSGTSLTLVTQSITFPAAGGPWRVLASYNYYTTNSSGTDNSFESYISDGSNQMAILESLCHRNTNGNIQGANASEVSPVTYANGATVTFSLLFNSAVSLNVQHLTSINSLPSRMSLAVMASN